MDKLGRNYTLEVETQSGDILTVTLPFTVEFDITRSTLSSSYMCRFRIYNLSLYHRNQLRFNISNYGHFRLIRFKAGYGTNLALAFVGNISQAWSVREGTNFITQIECYDGGFAFVNGTTEITIPAGTPRQTAISSIMAAGLPNTSVGAVGSYPGSLSRGNSFNGNTADVLRDMTGGGFFIDNGKANALNTDEYIVTGNGPIVINAATGLLGTPTLEETIVHFDMIFEPHLVVGQAAFIQSLTEANYNGLYKITGVRHKGMISETVCGEAVTTGEFYYTKQLTGVAEAS